MAYVVLDTDVASQSIKNRLPGPLAAKLTGYSWAVSFVTVGELWHWAEMRNWGGPSRDHLERWLSRVVVVESDEAVSRAWGRIYAQSKRRGRPRPQNDSWIAACCLANELPLATLNTKDYLDFAEHNGLELITA